MPHHLAAAATLLVVPTSPAPRLQLGPSRRARRPAALRSLPQRLAAVESTPPPSSAPLAPNSSSGLDAGSGGGDDGGDGGGGADFGWLRVFPHVLTASMSNFLFGYHIGVMNGPIEDIARELGFQGNPFLQGLVVSIFIVGAFFGSLSSSALVDKFGCKKTLQIDSIPLIIGALLRYLVSLLLYFCVPKYMEFLLISVACSSILLHIKQSYSAQADSLDEMLLGRFLVGIGIGVNTVLVPLYISEVAPTKYRGFLGTLCQIGTCLGIIAALSLGIPSESDPHWWRTMLYAACVPGFLIVVGMQFAVESPRWLAKVGRFDDARKVVESLWEPSEVDKSMEEIKAVVANDDSQSIWSDLLVEPHNREHWLEISLAHNGLGYPSSYEIYVGNCRYIFSFAIGAGPVTGLIIPELSSARTRSKVMGFSFTVHWICNFLVGLYFLELVKKFGVGAVYAGFGGVSLLTALFAYNFIVETKGRSLEEIEMSLSPGTRGERE
nr:unnamed protein product [Digitaria exilis]